MDGSEYSEYYRRRLPHWQPAGATIFVTYRLADSLPVEVLAELRASRALLSTEPLRTKETEEDRSIRISKQMFGQMDTALTTVSSPKWLGERTIAMLIRDNLKYWNDTYYHLHRYVIMPNHVHILIEPLPKPQACVDIHTPAVAQTVSLPEDDIDRQTDSLRYDSLPRNAGCQPALAPAQPQTDSLRYDSQDIVTYWPLGKIMQALKGYTAREANRLLGRQGRFWQIESFDHYCRGDDECVRIAAYIDGNPVSAGLCSYAYEWEWSSAFEEYMNGNADCQSAVSAG